MADLDVVAILKAKPGSEDLVREALTGLIEPTLAEDGCISYALFLSNSDPTTFVTIEKWRAQADLDAHMTTPHIQQLIAVAGDHFDAAPIVHPLSPVG